MALQTAVRTLDFVRKTKTKTADMQRLTVMDGRAAGIIHSRLRSAESPDTTRARGSALLPLQGGDVERVGGPCWFRAEGSAARQPSSCKCPENTSCRPPLTRQTRAFDSL